MADIITRQKFPARVNRAAVAAEWRSRGFTCDLFVDPPGRRWQNFTHACDELLTVAEGRLEVTVGAQRFLAEPGDEMLIPRGAQHSVHNVHRAATRWLYGYARQA
jgi:mannose-6-phosphate isomerase-like protein (cupin superfamily)